MSFNLKINKFYSRGISANPVLNGYCGEYEYGMDKSVVFEEKFNYGWPLLKSAVSKSDSGINNGTDRQQTKSSIFLLIGIIFLSLYL